jgi:hypothetical protein
MAPLQSFYTDVLRENSVYIGAFIIVGLGFALYLVGMHGLYCCEFQLTSILVGL